jgi:hypothetical protein
VGFVAIFNRFSGFGFFLLPNRVHARPAAATDSLSIAVGGNDEKENKHNERLSAGIHARGRVDLALSFIDE